MKTILPNIQVSKTTENNFIINASGKYFSVTEETVILLEMMTEANNINQLADNLSARFGYRIPVTDVANAIDALPNAFFETEVNVAKFAYSFPIAWGMPLNFLAKNFSALFNPYVSLPIMCFFCYFFFTKIVLKDAENTNSIATPFLILASILFHEIGHAAACYSVKAKPGLIGFGMKGVFPTFYTDVSDVWRKGRKERLIVDSGGIYFQLIFAGTLILFVDVFPSLITAINVIILLAFFSSLPIYKFDGHWLLGDLLSVNSLDLWLKNELKKILTKLRKKEFGEIDFAKTLGLVAYVAFFILVHIWFIVAFYSLLTSYTKFSLENIRFLSSENFATEDLFNLKTALKVLSFALLTLITIPAITLVLRLLRKLMGQRLLEVLIDIRILTSAFFKLFLIHLLSPVFGILKKNKDYLKEVQAAFLGVNPKFEDTKSLARKTLISSYTEHLWYHVLDNVSVRTGLWLVFKTHHIRSPRTLDNVKNTPGAIVIAAPHFGSFITGAIMLLSKIGSERPIHLFYADPKTDKGNALYESFYRRYFPSLSVCFNNRRGIIHAANALRREEVLVIMPDVFHGENLLKIQMLGRNVDVMPGIAYFHRKFDAKIIPVLSTFSTFFNVDIHVGNELFCPQSQIDDKQDQTNIMSILFTYFEKWFRARPHEWLCWGQFFRHSKKIDASE